MPRRRPTLPLLRLAFLRVLLFAAIGAAATVLVAWTLYFRDPGMKDSTKRNTNAETAWPSPVPPGWPQNAEGIVSARGLGSESRTWHSVKANFDTGSVELFAIRVFASGWPMVSMQSQRSLSLNRDATTPIPWLPLWPGFLVDTAFWGGGAFVVWSVPGFVRRGVRRRRGRCVRCGYELAGVEVCPECGGAA